MHNNSLDVFSSASWLTNGKILLHPTEGVWGIGCDALNEKSFLRVYELKKRPRNKSFILLAKSLKEVKKYIRNSNDLDLNFINNIWPGPTTLLVIFYLCAFYFLTFVVDKLPIAIVYATWSGLGIFTIAILGYIFFKQTLAWQAILGLFLIVIGVVLVNSFTVKLN